MDLSQASSLPNSPVEMPEIRFCDSPISPIKAALASPSAIALVLTRVPPSVHVDRSLEIELACVGHVPGDVATHARWLSAHALISIAVDTPGQPRVLRSVPISARPSDGCCICRALINPAVWAGAASVAVLSLSLAGRLLPCDCLPTILHVGYNHAPAPARIVYRAAKRGDVSALLNALDAGSSTEEADAVRVRRETVETSVPPPDDMGRWAHKYPLIYVSLHSTYLWRCPTY